MLHCWKDKIEWSEETYGFGSAEWAEAILHGGTCMLQDGHDGDHEFVADNDVVIEFIEGRGENLGTG